MVSRVFAGDLQGTHGTRSRRVSAPTSFHIPSSFPPCQASPYSPYPLLYQHIFFFTTLRSAKTTSSTTIITMSTLNPNDTNCDCNEAFYQGFGFACFTIVYLLLLLLTVEEMRRLRRRGPMFLGYQGMFDVDDDIDGNINVDDERTG